MALGIETIKGDVLFLVNFAKALETAVKNKFAFADDIALLSQLSQLPVLIKGKDQLVAELKDLTPDEQAQLVTFIEANVNLGNAKAEAILDAVLELVPGIWKLIEAFKTEVPAAIPPPTA